MRRTYQVASIIIFLAASYVIVESRSRINYYTEYGPGPGFFPFWCGVLMVILTSLWFYQVTFKPVEEGSARDLIPSRAASIRVVAVVVSLCLFAILMGYLGFALTMFAFLLIMLFALGRQRVPLTLALSLILSWGITYVFRGMLDVQLPLSSIEFLANLGL